VESLFATVMASGLVASTCAMDVIEAGRLAHDPFDAVRWSDGPKLWIFQYRPQPILTVVCHVYIVSVYALDGHKYILYVGHNFSDLVLYAGMQASIPLRLTFRSHRSKSASLCKILP